MAFIEVASVNPTLSFVEYCIHSFFFFFFWKALLFVRQLPNKRQVAGEIISALLKHASTVAGLLWKGEEAKMPLRTQPWY